MSENYQLQVKNTKLTIKGEDFEFTALHYTPYELEKCASQR